MQIVLTGIDLIFFAILFLYFLFNLAYVSKLSKKVEEIADEANKEILMQRMKEEIKKEMKENE